MDNVISYGNYLFRKDLKIPVAIDDTFPLSSRSHLLEGIKLTPEILEDIAGFSYDEIEVSWFHRPTGFRLYPKISESMSYEGFYLKQLPYVVIQEFHTLQNLFQIITKQPLIKTKPLWQNKHLLRMS